MGGPFQAAVASYSLHTSKPTGRARPVVGLLEPDGSQVIEEFGWSLLDQAAPKWLAQAQGDPSVEPVLADWRGEQEGLHASAEMRRVVEDSGLRLGPVRRAAECLCP